MRLLLAAVSPPIEKLQIPTVSWAAIAPFLFVTGGDVVRVVGG